MDLQKACRGKVDSAGTMDIKQEWGCSELDVAVV